ncbi:hypothetical protein [Janthinobacterium svalbardensis]|uniref:hypothetical protein n=1 Tax=Janthinobacterium svalbardensis TaxID=368607 RepID=UPI001ABFA317|nr:hypothetical protein [Janthinobacterium svalbardensis]
MHIYAARRRPASPAACCSPPFTLIKVLFGSDGPWLHPGLELHKVQLLGLPPLDAALIMGGNFLRLAGLA